MELLRESETEPLRVGSLFTIMHFSLSILMKYELASHYLVIIENPVTN